MQNFNPRPPPQNNPYSNTYNPGWRNHPNFSYRNNNPLPPNASQPQPPSFQHRAPYNPSTPQPPTQPKFKLENLMEHFIATQTKTNEVLSEQINQLSSKFDVMASHQKAMDTQIAQIAQLVSSLPRSQGQLPSQPEVNSRGHVNVVYTRNEGVVESPVMVLQEVAPVPISTRITTLKKGLRMKKSKVINPLQSNLISLLILTLRGCFGLNSLNLSPDSRDSLIS